MLIFSFTVRLCISRSVKFLHWLCVFVDNHSTLSATLNRSSSFLAIFLAKTSMTSSRSSLDAIFRYTGMVISPNPDNLSAVIVERRYVFTRCMVLKAFSAEDVVTGMHRTKRRHNAMSGYKSWLTFFFFFFNSIQFKIKY